MKILIAALALLSSAAFADFNVTVPAAGQYTCAPSSAPKPPPVITPPPTNKWGQREGTSRYITRSQERAGIGTVCVPNCRRPKMIIFDGNPGEDFIPGCVGDKDRSYGNIQKCRRSSSYVPGVTYAERLPVGKELANASADFKTVDTLDKLHSYAGSVSRLPGDLTGGKDARCTASKIVGNKSVYLGLTTAPRSWACNLRPNTLYYVNTRATGPQSKKCNKSLECHINVDAG